MDDQNQTNQSLGQSTVPTNDPQFPPIESVVLNQPEDITPSATLPQNPAFPEMASTEPVTMNESLVTEPVPSGQGSVDSISEMTPGTTDVSTPSLQTPPVTMESSEPAEPPMPEAKKKSKVFPIIGGVAALLLVVGVAGAAYYVSNQLSTRQAVAPTAPESEPQAYVLEGGGSGQVTIKPPAGTTINIVRPVATDDDEPAPKKTPTPTKAPTPRNIPEGTGTDGLYVGVTFNPGDTVSVGGTVYKKDAPLKVNDKGVLECAEEGYYLCTIAGSNECCKIGSQTTTAAIGGDGGTSGGSTSTNCITWNGYIANPTQEQERQVICNPNKDKFNTVTFSEACVARVYYNTDIAGSVIALTKDGVATPMTRIDDKKWDVNVTPGTYTITAKLGNEDKNAMGFRVPNSSGICQMFGAPYNVSSFLQASTLKALGIDSVTQVDRPVQCWGDMIKGADGNTRGELNSNYDFNDFSVVIGCKDAETSVPGYCALLRIYKKVNGVYSPTHMTTADLQNMVVGDTYRLTVTNNLELLPTRFRVTISGVVGGWMDGTFNATNKKIVEYNDLVITSPGTYKFEAQVVPIPMTGVNQKTIEYTGQ